MSQIIYLVQLSNKCRLFSFTNNSKDELAVGQTQISKIHVLEVSQIQLKMIAFMVNYIIIVG